MGAYLSRDVLDYIEEAGPRKDGGNTAAAVVSGTRRIAVRRRWETGFAIDADDARHLRGLVELYEGERLIGWCLVCHVAVTGAEHSFEYKRFTPCDGTVAPRDYVPEDRPVALMPPDPFEG